MNYDIYFIFSGLENLYKITFTIYQLSLTNIWDYILSTVWPESGSREGFYLKMVNQILAHLSGIGVHMLSSEAGLILIRVFTL